MIAFLIRSCFWFSLVLLVLPFDDGRNSADASSVGAIQTLVAAGEAVGDVAGICGRKPEVCETGKSALQTIGIRAREGARVAYEFLDEQLGATDETTTSGGIAPKPATPARK